MKTIALESTTQQVQQNQIVVTLDDVSLMGSIRKAISLMRGVKSVSLPKKKRISGIERSMQEVKAGKLYEAKDLDDLFEQLNS